MITLKELKAYSKLSIRNLFKRKLRSWLTIIGIFIGVAAIVALIALGQGLQDSIKEQFALLGTDKIIITPGGPLGNFGVSSENIKITKEEIEAIKKIKGVALVAPSSYRMGKVEFENSQRFTYVWGITLDKSATIYEATGHLNVESGRRIKENDRYKAQAGWLFFHSNDYFPKKMRPGSNIKIEGINFEIVGITKKMGNRQDDTIISIPIDIFNEIYKTENKYDYVMVQVVKGADINKIGEDISKILRKKRNEEEGKESFNVQTAEDLLESFSTILSIVQAVLIAIAAISLLVGGVGIMNTMYTSVLERTREIGIMKAVGAKNSQVLMIFLIEAGLIGLLGGIIGIFLGVVLSKVAVIAIGQILGTDLIKESISVSLIFTALGFSFIVGCLSGIMPALRASKLEPVDALRK
ncbi:MAG: ABC transporter permease [Candidatus Woesearchaeota archaeon]